MSQKPPEFIRQEDGVKIVFPDRTTEMKGDPDHILATLHEVFAIGIAIGNENSFERGRDVGRQEAQPSLRLDSASSMRDEPCG